MNPTEQRIRSCRLTGSSPCHHLLVVCSEILANERQERNDYSMKCKKCGHDEFNGHQLTRSNVVVDESGRFLRNHSDDPAKDIYDLERPYGPFKCLKCGAECDEMDESMCSPHREDTTGDAERAKKKQDAIYKAMITGMFRR